MVNKDFNNILELQEAFPDEQSCIDQLEAIRWNGNVVSPYDETSIVYKCSRLTLRKWFVAVWLVTCNKTRCSIN
jgi:hypothetical protein